MSQVVDWVEDLTPGWLSGALRIPVRSVASERIGTGQTGASYRLVLESAAGDRTVVAKLAAGDDAARRRVAGGYRNEVGFYTRLAETVDVCTPRCWYAAISDDARGFTLLLDDLAPRVPGVQADGCSVAQARDGVANLVGLHAPRWNDPSLFDHEFLARPSPERGSFVAAMLSRATDTFVERYGDDLGAADVATLRSVAEVIGAWEVARPEPFTIVHGDYRLDNLLFPAEGDGVAAVDWQTVAIAPPARDLAYFLGTSLRVEDRRASEAGLVAAYHAGLIARGVVGYDFERCFDDYRLGQLQGPMITVIGCAYATARPTAEADRMFTVMARRSCAAIRDLDALALL